MDRCTIQDQRWGCDRRRGKRRSVLLRDTSRLRIDGRRALGGES